MRKSNEPFLKRIANELSSAAMRLSVEDYQDLLEEVHCDVEGRLDGLEADRREAADDDE